MLSIKMTARVKRQNGEPCHQLWGSSDRWPLTPCVRWNSGVRSGWPFPQIPEPGAVPRSLCRSSPVGFPDAAHSPSTGRTFLVHSACPTAAPLHLCHPCLELLQLLPEGLRLPPRRPPLDVRKCLQTPRGWTCLSQQAVPLVV